MGLINLSAYPRTETGKNQNRRLRGSGRTPAVIYGNERDAANSLEVDTAELQRALAKGGRTPLFNLSIEGRDTVVTVLRELQRHPVSEEIFHVDLMEIPLNRPVTFEVSIDVQGENRLVRGGDATLEIARRVVEVECLPRDLPDSFTIDITEMEIGDSVTVAGLELDKVNMLTDPEETLLKLNPNTIVDIDEELAEAEEGVEGEEGAEGAEADGDADGEEAKNEPASEGD